MTPLLQTTGLIEPVDSVRTHVFLRPGDWLVGRGPHRVSTLLGSCVSVVMWAPVARVGAMCHCLLPDRPRHVDHDALRGPGHYVDEALDWLDVGLRERGVSLVELEISVVGGGCCMDSGIGHANVQAAMQWLLGRGLRPLRYDTGGAVVRKLNWNLSDGELLIAEGGHVESGRV